MIEHVLYTDADAERPEVICDANGSVVLSLCKACGKGESELLDGECAAIDAARSGGKGDGDD